MTFVGGVTRGFLILSLALFGTWVNAGPARAGGPSCSYDADTKTVTATAVENFQQVSMMLDNGEIEASGTDCGAATRFNTDKVIVNDVAAHRLEGFITLAGGRFRPGFTNEPGSSDEIEFVFNLGDGSPQWFDVHGTDGDDNFRVGSFSSAQGPVRRVNLNAGERTGVDHDVVVNGDITDLILEGFGGNDVFGATGGAGTGQPYEEKANFSGDDNADRLFGGEIGDNLTGDAGRDSVVGFEGLDDLGGGAGRDTLKAGRGNDILYGNGGDDNLMGGPDNDSCFDTQGDNTFESCESINEM